MTPGKRVSISKKGLVLILPLVNGPLEDGKAGGVVVGDSVFRAIGQRGGRKWRIDLLDRIGLNYLCYT